MLYVKRYDWFHGFMTSSHNEVLVVGSREGQRLIQSTLDLVFHHLKDGDESSRCQCVSTVCTFVNSSLLPLLLVCSCLLAKVYCSDINKSCDEKPL